MHLDWAGIGRSIGNGPFNLNQLSLQHMDVDENVATQDRRLQLASSLRQSPARSVGLAEGRKQPAAILVRVSVRLSRISNVRGRVTQVNHLKPLRFMIGSLLGYSSAFPMPSSRVRSRHAQ